MQTARDKIRELRALHEDGLLSLQEFDSRKNAILDAEYAPPGGVSAPVRQGTEIGLMAGQEIGPQNRRYKLERLIAQGGMGQVWQAMDLATHEELGHSACVALKILPPQLTVSPTLAKLLVEEATQARRLAHENIVRVYEWAQDPATASYFIIMECLEGEDLDSLLAREGPFSLERATGLLAPVAEALAYAWERHRLVHRDIKPGNVFVTKKGEVKLLDFGIAARARSSASNIGLEAPASSGTAGYRAPEAGVYQREPARALDVYAVAVMIYQMVEGRMPFDGVRSAAHQPPQPAALTAPQWQVLQSGFAMDPEQRPASVADLLDQLRRAAAPTPQQIAAEQAEARAREELRQKQLAAQRKANAQAAAAAQLIRDQERRAKEKAERALAEAARRERKEALRQQLRDRRAADAEKARLEQEERQRKLLQAKAAAAYREEQHRARLEAAARVQAELDRLLPTAASPVADTEGVLRDRFLDGSGVAPDLVLIPTGRFQMGSPEHERKKAMEAGSLQSWLDRETPQHWVGIEQPIALGRYPVTVGEWRRFAEATGWQPHEEFNWDAPGFAQGEDHPVVGVSWHDAQRYVAWLGEMTGQRYRLPSEAEWEYACRAGTKTAFSFGDAISTDLANFDGNHSYNGSAMGEYRRGTTRVGEFPPNPWGLYDMHGNVWEWVQDPVHDNYDGAPNTGAAWEEGGDPGRRILRGGSWLYSPRYLRSALRNGFSAGRSNGIVGFRVARNLL
ncbi:bifunctional serine/threonine-protein kinase/formylglycine-generating enzyme family protein [Massilia sp. R2A-15]|uniref:bifunctional serine/threonine-protein kinase/formylglycine-generating enzyme family protein n=1 Tax=Massilia sp. R2A-15 TaxID=3064278 RepID=UPI002735175B|nr:bifunctional serine/threonine-protein kinase/formylglycine-generating enzyme family protein [Massilia sp. R2A-15]WLI90931.1 bifunctional serine/threonine-protein kinase/formylglycine-generating enzyme family protein [Massilia sp. R2A-15]